MADRIPGHQPPTWFRDAGGYRFRGPRPAWHFGPARPNQGRVAPCGIGLISGYEVSREPIGGRVCKVCGVAVLGLRTRQDSVRIPPDAKNTEPS